MSRIARFGVSTVISFPLFDVSSNIFPRAAGQSAARVRRISRYLQPGLFAIPNIARSSGCSSSAITSLRAIKAWEQHPRQAVWLKAGANR